MNIEKIADLISNRKQNLILFPTEQCNFRCTYCYEDYTLGKMSLEVIQGIKNLLRKRIPDLDDLYISWFGGEPLIAKDIVLDISEYASKLSKEYKSNFRSGMTTNGYLLSPSTFSKLINIGILDYQITLDGPSKIHNQTRLRADGQGTFNKIWSNLIAMKEFTEPFSITLRIHVSPNNISELEELITSLHNNFIDDKRFKILFKTIGHLGGINDSNFEIFSGHKKEEIINQLERKFYGKDYIKKEKEPYICYASRPNSLTIRSDGSLGKCTVALSQSHNNIGSINPDGTLKINQEHLSLWLRGLSDFDYNILGCPLKGIEKIMKKAE
ncbi:radical SAM protein [Bacillus bombysepticus]